MRSQQGLRYRADACGLVIPLHVIPNLVPLHESRMDPVDVRPALGCVHGAGAAENEHGRLVQVGAKDRHGGMLQPDHVVKCHGHRPACDTGIAGGDRHRDLLVVAEHHLWVRS